MTRIKTIAAVVVGGLILVGAGITWTVGPQNLIGMARYDQRQEGRLKVGDQAPDVELLSIDGKRRERLAASFGEKPLVLVFGSFT